MELDQGFTSKKSWFSSLQKLSEKLFASSSTSERIVFFLLVAACVTSGLLVVWRINNSFLVEVAESGGKIEEGVIGIPRFINPVLAASDADKDLTSLIYSGLLKATPEGTMVPDAAKEYSISEDNRTYRFILRDNITFHDGMPVTTDDIEFTIQKIQDPGVKSPKRAIWDGVTVTKNSPTEISFTLRQPYAAFIDNLSIGILPKHVWKDVPVSEFSFSQFNVSPIGSGPYRIKDIKRNSIGLPIYYNLIPFKNYMLGTPYINHLVIKLYQNEKELVTAYNAGDIGSLSGISGRNTNEIIKEESMIATSTLPRVFGVFFNQNQATVFVNKEVRQALAAAIDKDQLIREVLSGYGKAINTPSVPHVSATTTTSTNTATTTATSTPSHTDQAIAILTKAGWALNAETGIMEKKVRNETTALRFSLATGDASELKQAAEIIKNEWQKIGAEVDVRIFETGDLNQNVIRPRKYDALFFGEVVGREKDLYPFWHSSQRNDPGLNIAMYTNLKTDKLLEDIRATTDKAVQQQKLAEFEQIITQDIPAAFVYAPEFIYILPDSVRNVKLGQITNSGERFLNVSEWYINTNKVWKIFTQ